ncbi:gametocyte-specific factor 1 homolog [Scaptodrosophila lebanonensis]|uniref:Gametocyte-specific factor 1 homolog n=1 Tax=Drosophila lebanonensis TaxID=7225 RepID=A0A6J2UFB6_DROLE|nr:gametocyte-specific factor 1 homolog [Scaptodrosophila lebanonensis]
MNFMESSSEMVTCPYNSAHRMLRKKLQQHIIKCRELYKNEIPLLNCPFNNSHLIPEPEFYQHTKSCEDRKIVAHFQFSESAPIKEDAKHEKISADEDWDEDNTPAYNPQVYAASANIVREPKGIFPAQRKDFIKEERKRLGDLSDEEKMPEPPPPPKISIRETTKTRHQPYQRRANH